MLIGRARRRFVSATLLAVFAVAACSTAEALTFTDPEYLADFGGEPLPFRNRVELAGLDHDVPYPDGWYAESGGPYTTIAADPADVRRWFDGEVLEGPLVFFEVESFGFIRTVGLDVAEPTPQDLFDFSQRRFGWREVGDRLDLELFGGEGLQVRVEERRGHVLGILGVIPDERVLLIMVVAPTATELDELLATWRAMIRSSQTTDPSA
jgi:hypothetical protein